jgi:hypothetical protein
MNEQDSNAAWGLKPAGRRLAILGGWLLIAVSAVWLAGGFDSEPEYQGKSADYWLANFNPYLVRNRNKVYAAAPAIAPTPLPFSPTSQSRGSLPPKLEEANQPELAAFRAMGRKGISFLIRTMERRPTKLDFRVSAFAAAHRLPEWLRRMLPDPNGRQQLSLNAAGALCDLWPQAAPALPAFSRLLRDPNASPLQTAIACVALQNSGATAPTVVPELCENLAATNALLRRLSVVVLGSIGPSAAAGLPALKTLARATNELALCCAQSILQINQDTNFAFQVWSHVLTSTNNALVCECLASVKSLGPAAKPMLPAVRLAYSGTNPAVRWWAADAIRKIDPGEAERLGLPGTLVLP